MKLWKVNEQMYGGWQDRPFREVDDVQVSHLEAITSGRPARLLTGYEVQELLKAPYMAAARERHKAMVDSELGISSGWAAGMVAVRVTLGKFSNLISGILFFRYSTR